MRKVYTESAAISRHAPNDADQRKLGIRAVLPWNKIQMIMLLGSEATTDAVLDALCPGAVGLHG